MLVTVENDLLLWSILEVFWFILEPRPVSLTVICNPHSISYLSRVVFEVNGVHSRLNWDFMVSRKTKCLILYNLEGLAVEIKATNWNCRIFMSKRELAFWLVELLNEILFRITEHGWTGLSSCKGKLVTILLGENVDSSDLTFHHSLLSSFLSPVFLTPLSESLLHETQ